jgi:uncharacterized protein with von Willebrand factor type A (vWA) domain
MPMNKIAQPASFYQFSWDFFEKLRQTRALSLTLGDYMLLLETMQKGLGLADKTDFLTACQLLWGKTETQNQFIAEQFEQYYVTLLSILPDYQQEETKQPILKDEVKDPKDTQQAYPTSSKETSEKTDTSDSSDKKPNNSTTEKTKNPKEKPKYDAQNAPSIVFTPPNKVGDLIDASPTIWDSDYLSYPYILSNDYLPISLRQMQQLWRRLRNTQTNGSSHQIDWKSTIQQTAQQGFFLQPLYEQHRSNQIKLVLLIDHHGSMAPYETLAEQLASSAITQGTYVETKVYYTHNIPNNYLYTNKGHSEDIAIDEVLQQWSHKNTVLLIFSDAGATRGTFNTSRISATRNFLDRIKHSFYAIAWLNPMPKHRWSKTSAEFIQLLVPMFETDLIGMESALKTLKSISLC